MRYSTCHGLRVCTAALVTRGQSVLNWGSTVGKLNKNCSSMPSTTGISVTVSLTCHLPFFYQFKNIPAPLTEQFVKALPELWLIMMIVCGKSSLVVLVHAYQIATKQCTWKAVFKALHSRQVEGRSLATRIRQNLLQQPLIDFVELADPLHFQFTLLDPLVLWYVLQ